MNRKSNEYKTSFDNAVELLNNNVNFFYVCPDYFLEKLEKRNSEMFNLFKNENFKTFFENENFSQSIKFELEKYLEDISDMDKKAYIISLWENFYDPTAFFTHLMGFDVLELREKVSNINYNDMSKTHEDFKNKKITASDALKKYNIKESDFKDYFERQASDFSK